MEPARVAGRVQAGTGMVQIPAPTTYKQALEHPKRIGISGDMAQTVGNTVWHISQSFLGRFGCSWTQKPVGLRVRVWVGKKTPRVTHDNHYIY